METANENETAKAPETAEVTEATEKELDCKLFLHHPEAFDDYVGDKESETTKAPETAESETCNKVVVFSTEYNPDKYKDKDYDTDLGLGWKAFNIAVEVFFLVCIVIVTASLIISSFKCL
jgi:hypothetical protein